jgi:hypothetical protein
MSRTLFVNSLYKRILPVPPFDHDQTGVLSIDQSLDFIALLVLANATPAGATSTTTFSTILRIVPLIDLRLNPLLYPMNGMTLPSRQYNPSSREACEQPPSTSDLDSLFSPPLAFTNLRHLAYRF